MPHVSHKHPEYEALENRWTLIADCIAGQEAVKAKGKRYLPAVEVQRLAQAERCGDHDTVAAVNARYQIYKQRAVFYNVVQRTHQGMVGQVFAKEPTVELPPALAMMEDDTDGGGVGLAQQAKGTLGNVIADGRAGLYVDYPRTEGSATRQQELDGLVRPTILSYAPEQLVNWRTEQVGARQMLTLVVIAESTVTEDDGFEAEYKTQYRALRLLNGVYTVEIYDEDEKLQERYTPINASGQSWRKIPFTFVGSENNDVAPDLPPMYDMSVLNIGHYVNSADYEELVHMVGQPTPVLAGMTQQWVEDVLKSTINLGSRGAIPLPEGGNADLLQAEERQLPATAMEAKEKQMTALGAKLVEPQRRERSATEAAQDQASETSLLASAANNVSEAYTQALAWAGEFVGSEGGELTLNTEFSLGSLTPEQRKQLLAEWQSGAITFDEYRQNLLDAGVASLDTEEAKDVLETEGIDNGGSP